MQNISAQFRGREHGPLVQFIKYALAGAVATVVHIFLFYLFALKLLPALNQHDVLAGVFHLHVVPASDAIRARNSIMDNMLAFLFSNFTAYLINIMWVFESGRHNRLLEIGLFYLGSGISTIIGTVLMGLLIDRFGIMTTIAFGANGAVSLVLNYALRKRLIFKK